MGLPAEIVRAQSRVVCANSSHRFMDISQTYGRLGDPRRQATTKFREILNTPARGAISQLVSWSFERQSLYQLRWASSLWEPAGPEWDVHDERLKRNHMVALSPSEDHQLLAAASAYSGVQVHEPLDPSGDTLRVWLRTPCASHAAWTVPDSHGEGLYVAQAYTPTVWRFNLESCAEDRPSQILQLPTDNSAGRPAHVVELSPISQHIVAAATSDGAVYMLDDRLERPAISSVHTHASGRAGAAISVHSALLYVGAAGSVSVYDRRKLPRPRGRGVLSFGASCAETGVRMEGPLASTRVANGSAPFAALRCVPGPGTVVAYQMDDGSVGYADLLGGKDARKQLCAEVCDPSQRGGSPMGELRSYGSLMSQNRGTWWVHRHRGCLIPAQCGSGWRFFAPLVHGSGFRAVGIRPGKEPEIVCVRTPRPVACVSPMPENGGCQRILVGYASVKVDLFMSKPSRGGVAS